MKNLQNILLVIFTLLASQRVPAQILSRQTTPVTPSIERMMIQTIDSALLLIRVEYVLREKKPKVGAKAQDFGKGELDYFGRVHGVAVVSDGQFWFDGQLLEPWKYADKESYEEYKDESQYQPVVKNIFLRRIDEKKFTEYSFKEDSVINLTQALGNLPLKGNYADMPSLSSQKPDLDTSGVVVLVTGTSSKQLETENLEGLTTGIQPGTILFDGRSATYKRNILTAKSKPTIGGIYCRLEPVTGNIKISFSGVLSALETGTDLILRPVLVNSTKRNQPKQELKPIGNKEKKGKGNN